MTALVAPTTDADFLPAPDAETRFCHAAVLAEGPDRSLACAWYSYPEREHEDGEIILSRRAPGRPWSKPVRPLKIKSSSGNPVLFYEGDRLWMLFVTLPPGRYWDHASAFSTSSADGGSTWDDPHPMGLPPGIMLRHPPLILGELWLLPVYDESSRRAIILRGRPGRWEVESNFADADLIQPCLLQDGQGVPCVYFRPAGDQRLVWRSRQIRPREWSHPLRTVIPSPPSGVSAVFALGRHWVFHHPTDHARTPLVASSSADGGVSWSQPALVDASPFELSYPSFMANASGIVRGVYTYNRRAIKYVELDLARVL